MPQYVVFMACTIHGSKKLCYVPTAKTSSENKSKPSNGSSGMYGYRSYLPHLLHDALSILPLQVHRVH